MDVKSNKDGLKKYHQDIYDQLIDCMDPLTIALTTRFDSSAPTTGLEDW
jgi:hypothetical protein